MMIADGKLHSIWIINNILIKSQNTYKKYRFGDELICFDISLFDEEMNKNKKYCDILK